MVLYLILPRSSLRLGPHLLYLDFAVDHDGILRENKALVVSRGLQDLGLAHLVDQSLLGV